MFNINNLLLFTSCSIPTTFTNLRLSSVRVLRWYSSSISRCTRETTTWTRNNIRGTTTWKCNISRETTTTRRWIIKGTMRLGREGIMAIIRIIAGLITNTTMVTTVIINSMTKEAINSMIDAMIVVEEDMNS